MNNANPQPMDYLEALVTELRNEMQMLRAGHYHHYTFLVPPENIFVNLDLVHSHDSLNIHADFPEDLTERLLAGKVNFCLLPQHFVSVSTKEQVNGVHKVIVDTGNKVGGSESYDFCELMKAIMNARAYRNQLIDTGEHVQHTSEHITRIPVEGSAPIARQVEKDEEGREYQSYYLNHQSGDMFDTVVFGAKAVHSEQVFAMLIDRFTHLNAQLPHDANLKTIEHLQAALQAQKDRYATRREAGIEGTDQA